MSFVSLLKKKRTEVLRLQTDLPIYALNLHFGAIWGHMKGLTDPKMQTCQIRIQIYDKAGSGSRKYKFGSLALLSKRCPPLHPIESKYRIMCAGASWRSSLNWTLPRSVRSSGPRIMKATSLVSCLSRKEWLCFGVTSVWAVLSWRKEICYLNIFFTVPMQTLLMEFSQLTSGSVYSLEQSCQVLLSFPLPNS
jgi:hypothetical protein